MVQGVPLEDTKCYCVVDVGGVQSYVVKLQGIEEKPSPAQPGGDAVYLSGGG